jgi:uncharacterized membrane protein YgaE (UPF0421/DUF939 family)
MAAHRWTLAELRAVGQLTAGDAANRGKLSARVRVARLRSRDLLIAQSAVGAAAAWFIAHDLVGHAAPFFAPVVALIVASQSRGQQLRRGLEVTVGVAIGIAIGDLFRVWSGIGWWQVGLVVAVATALALLAGAGQLMTTQAGVQAIVVTTVVGPNGAFNRWVDAVIGGMVALVLALVVPSRATARPRELAGALLDEMAAILDEAVAAIVADDEQGADQVLARARDTETLTGELSAAVTEGLGAARLPVLWRRRARTSADAAQISRLTPPLDRATRNARVLVRRSAVSIWRGDEMPAGTVALIRRLRDVTAAMADDLAAHRDLTPRRAELAAIGVASSAHDLTPTLSTTVVLAQIRSIVVDLAEVTGLDAATARDAVPPIP